MRVINNNGRCTTFDDAMCGDVILYQGDYYLVTEEIPEMNCVNLKSGEIYFIPINEEVHIFDEVDLMIKG